MGTFLELSRGGGKRGRASLVLKVLGQKDTAGTGGNTGHAHLDLFRLWNLTLRKAGSASCKGPWELHLRALHRACLPNRLRRTRGNLAEASPCLAGEATFGFSPGLSWKWLCSRLAAVLAGKEQRGKPSSRGLAARQDTWAFSLAATENEGRKFYSDHKETGVMAKR